MVVASAAPHTIHKEEEHDVVMVMMMLKVIWKTAATVIMGMGSTTMCYLLPIVILALVSIVVPKPGAL